MTWHPSFQPKMIKNATTTRLHYTVNSKSSQNPFLLFRDFVNSAWALEPCPLLDLDGERIYTSSPGVIPVCSRMPTPWPGMGKKRKKERNIRIWPFILFCAYLSLKFEWNSVRGPDGLLWLKFNFLSVCKLFTLGDNPSYLGFGERYI